MGWAQAAQPPGQAGAREQGQRPSEGTCLGSGHVNGSPGRADAEVVGAGGLTVRPGPSVPSLAEGRLAVPLESC